MLKFTLILILLFFYCIASTNQTRIKIGSKSWGYQIDLNHGNQIRNEFSNEEGLTTGYYIFKKDNQTKKLQYTIDPNRMEPDIEFKVINIDGNMIKDLNLTSGNHSTTTECSLPNSNMTFDSIDSNQDFKGHVTLKVGNASYSINFATGDKSNSREEVLTPSGLMYGRYNYMLKNSPHKIVINYKFNSTSPDPSFEVSLFKSLSDAESSYGRERDRSDSINSITYPTANYRAPYQRGHPYAVPASHSLARAQQEQHQPTRSQLSDKYRQQMSNSNPSVPSWYYNRNKAHEP